MSQFEKIPNNVDLSSDKRLQRALETWQPDFISWWREMGPEGFQDDQIYLRTAISVDPNGWAHYDYVKMPDYRWGIFLANEREQEPIGFGDNLGLPSFDEVRLDHHPDDPLLSGGELIRRVLDHRDLLLEPLAAVGVRRIDHQACGETGRREATLLMRRLGVLETIAAISPLMGLLGTVLGIMHGAPEPWAAPLGDLLETYLRGKERLSIRKLAARTVALAQR